MDQNTSILDGCLCVTSRPFFLVREMWYIDRPGVSSAMLRRLEDRLLPQASMTVFVAYLFVKDKCWAPAKVIDMQS